MLERLRTALSDPLLPAAWQRLHRLWRPMAAWTLVLWVIVVVLLVPLSSALVTWRLGSSDATVIGNEQLIAWLLTPAGAAYLLFAGSVAVVNWVLRYAGLFQIITDDLEGRPPSFRGTGLRLAGRITTLMRFSIKAVALALCALAPVVAGVWLIQRAFLGDYDINFYLSAKPPAWYYALLATGLWFALCALTLAYLGGRIVLALPTWLDGYRGFVVALRRSWALTRKRGRRLLRLLGLSAAGWLLGPIVIEAAFFAAASRVTEWVAANSNLLWPTMACAGAYLAGSLLLNVTIEFLGFSFLATVLTKFYYEDTPLHRAAPAGPHESGLPARKRLLAARWLSPQRLVPILALLLATSILLGRQALSRLPEQRPVVIVAHRAGPAPAPENTLAALERAIAAGADFAEIDVLRTRDGVVVVTHDADLMRLARDPRRIADSTYAELRQVVKLPDDGTPPEERRLATLGDFLERARGRIGLNIELKYYRWDPLLADAVVQEIRARRMEDQVVLTSLHVEAVRQARRLAPDIPLGYISTLAVGSISRLPVDFVAVHQRRVTRQLLRESRQRGQQVHAWTVNSTAAMADLLELGVDGIITDEPERAVRVRDEIAGFSPIERLLLRFRKLLLEEEQPGSAP